MGSSTGLAGLKCLQWTFRGVEFGCSLIILAVYSYYLATMSNHGMDIPTGVKAVEGIAAVGTLYTALGLLLICCCAGYPASSFVSLVFDLALAAAYVYVAVANRAGTGCGADPVYTVYGAGDGAATPGGGDAGMTGVQQVTGGATRLPTFQLACQLMMACLIVACVAIPFFLASILLEIHINRTRFRANRPVRDAEGEYITKSAGQFGGAAPPPPQRRHGLKGLRGFTFRGNPHTGDPDALPAHSQLGEARTHRVEVPAWGDVSSLHDSDRLEFNDGQATGPPVRMTSTTAPRPAADEYTEGDVGDRVYGLYAEDEHGNDHSEVGKTRKHNESKAARMERLTQA